MADAEVSIKVQIEVEDIAGTPVPLLTEPEKLGALVRAFVAAAKPIRLEDHPVLVKEYAFWLLQASYKRTMGDE